ncbi:hypothetical protein PIROE2DRAFT_15782 [Piromyces sp. E2]|nr:hypothetical protein PIROE2DRAFT_15782 [Piromyces sp. E2]|eukprot:OUM58853.1 hypothetical protein PIROE2DRAFT_15782 [Piromyces sp. E2]
MKNFIYNSGDEDFRIFLSNKYYVDKTELIYHLNEIINTLDRYVCVSRPRRFGKTVTADMLTAYYSYSEKKTTIFNDKIIGKIYSNQNEIEEHIGNDALTIIEHKSVNKCYKYLNEFNVIRLVMNKYFANYSVEEGIKEIKYHIISEIENIINNLKFTNDRPLFRLFEEINRKTNRQISFIIDEWDYVLRHNKDKQSIYSYLEFLNTFLKDEKYIALAYLTGILPLKKDEEQSSLNNFDVFSMISPLWMAKYIGFTDYEVEKLCQIYEEMKNEKLKDNSKKILKRQKGNDGKCIKNYSEKKEIQGLKDKNNEDLKRKYIYNNEVCYKNIRNWYNGYQLVDIDFKNKDDILTMFIHLGYLGYEVFTNSVFIPNNEILQEFKKCTESSNWSVLFGIYEQSETLLKETWNCNGVRVAELIEKAHDTADNKTYNSEAALKYAILLAYYAANKYYTIIPETDSGKGYADIFFIPVDKIHPALIVELKYNDNPKSAINQIKEQNYPQRLIHYINNLILIDINYDIIERNNSIGFKHHSCKIEKFKNEKKK